MPRRRHILCIALIASVGGACQPVRLVKHFFRVGAQYSKRNGDFQRDGWRGIFQQSDANRGLGSGVRSAAADVE
ncbi:MAG: hypothetical protein V3T05_04465, partial [Myxococcota bacterium]